MPSLVPLVERTFRLLQRTTPAADDYDVAWHGPYFVPRSGSWHPTRFLLYGGHLYCTVWMGWKEYGLTWKVGTQEVAFGTGLGPTGGRDDGQFLWVQVLVQVTRKLRRALADPPRYNRWVERYLPSACRTGRIERRWSWPRRTRPPMPRTEAAQLEKLLERAAARQGYPRMTRSKYLQIAAVAYDAAFADLRPLAPLAKHRRRADTRHGGLLDLPGNDPDAFASWYRSRAWSGSHPWEIVVGHPHGILLSPVQDGDRWRFFLSVDSLGWYRAAATMALALAEDRVPLQFFEVEKVLAALQGVDTVEVGPFPYQLLLEELDRIRPGARDRILWDPIPAITPIAAKDRERVAHVLATGRPPASTP